MNDSRRADGPRRLSGWLVLTALAFSTRAAGGTDGQEIARAGNGRGAPACSACHGPRGQGNLDSGAPRLAGLSAAYLAQQLADFDRGTRESDIMKPIAKALDPDERRAVTSFYSSISAKAPEGTADEKLAANGAGIALIGRWSKGLPACAQCHGVSGEGVGNAFPALAGQPASYIAGQLTAWKDKKRQNDPLGLMAGVASKLSEDEIAGVAAYYASLPVTPAAAGEQQGAAP